MLAQKGYDLLGSVRVKWALSSMGNATNNSSSVEKSKRIVSSRNKGISTSPQK